VSLHERALELQRQGLKAGLRRLEKRLEDAKRAREQLHLLRDLDQDAAAEFKAASVSLGFALGRARRGGKGWASSSTPREEPSRDGDSENPASRP